MGVGLDGGKIWLDKNKPKIKLNINFKLYVLLNKNNFIIIKKIKKILLI
jgi:hypothetical protein